MPGSQIGSVRRELLVRQLDAWVPAALHRSRRAVFAQMYEARDDATAEAALRAVAEFADRLRGRRLALPILVPSADGLGQRLEAVQRELGTPAELSVHVVAGDASRLPAVLSAVGAAGAPVLAYLDASGLAPPEAALAAVAGGRPAEVLLALGEAARSGLDHRAVLRSLGFPLLTEVELVDREGDVELVVFATSLGKSLEAFKDAMWAVDDYAGVRYRDPNDPEGHLLDISLTPHPGPLRRELLAHLAAAGAVSMTDLRRVTLTDTVYRTADTVRAVTALLAAGQVTREPAHGRLGGDVLITAAPGRTRA
ncbi:MAG TPA: hypothetical protein VHN18_02780 [Micromonosporaceae bacterium]|nr:hypothetical protein [Micromonosporaceae bacterium]